MTMPGETIGQGWLRELSLVDQEVRAVELANARREILSLNPTIGFDHKALHCTAQGWVAAQVARTPSVPENGGEISTQSVHAEEYELMMRLLRQVFQCAYAHGRFDAKNGFNSSSSAEDLSAAWIDENADLLGFPIQITELMKRLHDETVRLGLT